MHDTKIVFMGTPDFSVPVLEKLIEKYNVVLVVTRPDVLVGRNRILECSPVKKAALSHNIDVVTPNKISEITEIIEEINPDLLITCAYGKILPEAILNIPKHGAINVHASLLPKYRGASPIQAALMNGDEKTGITIMYMDKTMDTGNIISQKEIKILSEDNYLTLSNKLSLLGANLLTNTIFDIILGNNQSIKQDDSKASYTKLIKREDEKITFDLLGKDIINKIRAFSPDPYVNFKLNDKEIKIVKAWFKSEPSEVNKVYITKKSLAIGCKDGKIYLEKVKPIGKNEMDIKAFLNGLNKNGEYYVS